MIPATALLLALLAAGPLAAPRFSVLTSALVERPGAEPRSITCVPGELAAGQPVLLLPEDGSSPCTVKTGGKGTPEAGQATICTELVGAERCGDPLIAVVGATKGRYEILPLKDLGRQRIPALAELVASSGVLAELVKLSLDLGGPKSPEQIDAVPVAVRAIPGLEAGPLFAELRLRDGRKGPLVVVANGRAVASLPSICAVGASPFSLDGVTYVRAGW